MISCQRCLLLVAGVFVGWFGKAQTVQVSPDSVQADAQPAGKKLVSVMVEGSAIATGEKVPFWMRSNQYGSVPLSGVSTSYIGRFEKSYRTEKNHFFDWSVGFEGRANIGKDSSNFTIIEAYGKIKLGMFALRLGRAKEMIGLADSTLSSGSFSMSGNALGIPKAEISVPEYYPFFGGTLFAFKGNFSHGWIGNVARNRLAGSGSEFEEVPTYFHQKSLYGRFGKPNWKINLYAGFNHQVFWGSEKVRYGGGYTLSTLGTFWYVLQGRMYPAISSKVGNHLGSIDLGLELNLKNIRMFAYRQSFYDVGALYYLANIKDGLHGLSIVNKKSSHSKLQWKKILFEYLTTKSQAGEPTAPDTKSGAEDYYNSSEYLQGWSYKGLGLGTPFISPRWSVRKGFPSDPFEYFINNRVSVLHGGVEGELSGMLFTAKLSYAKNYGTWKTSSYGRRKGGPSIYVDPPIYGVFKEVNQLSSYLELSKRLRSGLRLGVAMALDQGDLLQNSAGLQLKVAKSF